MVTHFLFEFVTAKYLSSCASPQCIPFIHASHRKSHFSTDWNKPFDVAVTLPSLQSKDSYFSLTHSHVSVSTLQVNNDNGTSSMQICKNVPEEEENNEKKGDTDGLHHFLFPFTVKFDYLLLMLDDHLNFARCRGYVRQG